MLMPTSCGPGPPMLSETSSTIATFNSSSSSSSCTLPPTATKTTLNSNPKAHQTNAAFENSENISLTFAPNSLLCSSTTSSLTSDHSSFNKFSNTKDYASPSAPSSCVLLSSASSSESLTKRNTIKTSLTKTLTPVSSNESKKEIRNKSNSINETTNQLQSISSLNSYNRVKPISVENISSSSKVSKASKLSEVSDALVASKTSKLSEISSASASASASASESSSFLLSREASLFSSSTKVPKSFPPSLNQPIYTNTNTNTDTNNETKTETETNKLIQYFHKNNFPENIPFIVEDDQTHIDINDKQNFNNDYDYDNYNYNDEYYPNNYDKEKGKENIVGLHIETKYTIIHAFQTTYTNISNNLSKKFKLIFSKQNEGLEDGGEESEAKETRQYKKNHNHYEYKENENKNQDENENEHEDEQEHEDEDGNENKYLANKILQNGKQSIITTTKATAGAGAGAASLSSGFSSSVSLMATEATFLPSILMAKKNYKENQQQQIHHHHQHHHHEQQFHSHHYYNQQHNNNENDNNDDTKTFEKKLSKNVEKFNKSTVATFNQINIIKPTKAKSAGPAGMASDSGATIFKTSPSFERKEKTEAFRHLPSLSLPRKALEASVSLIMKRTRTSSLSVTSLASIPKWLLMLLMFFTILAQAPHQIAAEKSKHYYMQSLCKSHFLQQLYRKIDGAVLWSQNERNLDCIITFQTHSILQRFMLRFDMLQLDCNDHLLVFDGAHAVSTPKIDISCRQTKQSVSSILTRTNFVTLKYTTDAWGTDANGFKLIITAVKDPKHTCKDFTCNAHGFCVHPDLKCDGINHCGDNSDESVPDLCQNETSSAIFGLDMTWFVLFVVSGLLLLSAVIVGISICVCRRQDNSNTNQSSTIQMHHSSEANGLTKHLLYHHGGTLSRDQTHIPPNSQTSGNWHHPAGPLGYHRIQHNLLKMATKVRPIWCLANFVN